MITACIYVSINHINIIANPRKQFSLRKQTISRSAELIIKGTKCQDSPKPCESFQAGGWGRVRVRGSGEGDKKYQILAAGIFEKVTMSVDNLDKKLYGTNTAICCFSNLEKDVTWLDTSLMGPWELRISNTKSTTDRTEIHKKST